MSQTAELAALDRMPSARATGWRLWWNEASGSVADLGVLLPIALALIVMNGLSVTAVLVPAGLTYLMVARVYRVPVSVQPLKAFGAAAIALGAGPDVIAAGSLIMGAVFLLLGATGMVGRLGRLFPLPVIRGVQISVGLTLCMVAWKLVGHPPKAFVGQLPHAWVAICGLGVVGALLVWRRSSALVFTAVGLVAAIASTQTGTATWDLGPTAIDIPHLSWSAMALAAVSLVLPQLPLTFANSCVAPADAARTYFGSAASRVTPDRLARTLGTANLAVGAVSGMPVCHGAGGMSAHYLFGARTWRAPLLIGSALLLAGLLLATPLASILRAFPLPILAAMLAVAGLAHLRLASDLRGWFPWTLALGIGVAGAAGYLAAALGVGLVAAALAEWLGRRGHGGTPPHTDLESDRKTESRQG